MPDFKRIAVADLVLDRQNPRLPTRLHDSDEDEILKYLASKTNIGDLITSIGENDFFHGEAIVVTQNGAPCGKYIVLEGNRRLTALRLLQDINIARSVSIAASEAVAKAKSRPGEVPAYEVDSRDDVLQYLGFRHVSGVQRWDPLAKARYLKMLYQQAEGDPVSRYRQIASEIGSRSDTVRKNLDALAAYELTERNEFFDVPNLGEENFQFGVFYTALASPRIAEFVGARDSDGPTHPIETESSPSLKTTELGEIVEWIFHKDESGRTRLGESRNIPKLAAVVSAPNALQSFRAGASLDDAHLDTPDVHEEFIREMRTAIRHIHIANSKLTPAQVENLASQVDVQGIVTDLRKATNKTYTTLSL